MPAGDVEPGAGKRDVHVSGGVARRAPNAGARVRSARTILRASPRSVFKSPELGRYELQRPLPGPARDPSVPPDVLTDSRLESLEDARTTGAYRHRTR